MEAQPGEDELKSNPRGGGPWQWKNWSVRRKYILALVALVLVIALAIGLGVGLGLKTGDIDGDGNKGEEEPAPPTNPPGGNETALWQPSVGSSWQIQLLTPLKGAPLDVDVYDIDLFDNEAAVISNLHEEGSKVICYFSAGSYEEWREDEDKFKESDKGDPLDGWPGERWLDVRSTNVRDVMRSRLQLAKDKGCDGVDPDNVDGYDNGNGLDLAEDDAIDYMKFLATASHELNLSIGLKNGGKIIPKLINQMQWSVNEQCVQYNECGLYTPFIRAGKPVFHLEYPKQEVNNNEVVSTQKSNKACDNAAAKDFSTLIKNMNLDTWVQSCPSKS